MKKQCRAPIVDSRPLGPDMFLHVYREPDIAAAARPGQFVNVRVSDATTPLLRRPFSILSADPDRGEFSVYFKVVGEGTEILARAGRGDLVDLVGPLGTTFDWQDVDKALLVGGGVGIAPLYFMALDARLARRRGLPTPQLVFAYGARDAGGLVLLDEIAAVADELLISTNDGSRGSKGLVTDLLDPYLTADYAVFCCGPTPMMAATRRRMAERGLNHGWFSLENQMGCAVGVCMGCVVPTTEGFRRICYDGPVVPAEVLDFSLFSPSSAP